MFNEVTGAGTCQLPGLTTPNPVLDTSGWSLLVNGTGWPVMTASVDAAGLISVQGVGDTVAPRDCLAYFGPPAGDLLWADGLPVASFSAVLQAAP